MKKEFSTKWKGSKQPRKKRKYLAKAPIHLKRKFLSSNLSKDLKKKHARRSLEVRKGDVVKIMKGKFKKKTGKITEVNTSRSLISIEGIQGKKKDGSKYDIKIHPSNLQLIELNLEDKERIKIKEVKEKIQPKKEKMEKKK